MSLETTFASSIDCNRVQCKNWDSDGLSHNTRAVMLLFWLAFFTLSQYTAWHVMNKFWTRFTEYTLSMQAENASRVNSTIHSVIVSPLLLIGVLYKVHWGVNFEAISNPSFLQAVLIVSVAYFLKDIVTIVLYRTPYWQVFLFHHVIACFPYINYLFNSHCTMGLYVLSCYMLVETSTITLNVVMWCRETDRDDKWYYTVSLYTTVVLWVIFRFANPLWCAICGEVYLVPYSKHTCSTLRVSLICGYFVNVFCWAVFKPILGDEILMRWRMSKLN